MTTSHNKVSDELNEAYIHSIIAAAVSGLPIPKPTDRIHLAMPSIAVAEATKAILGAHSRSLAKERIRGQIEELKEVVFDLQAAFFDNTELYRYLNKRLGELEAQLAGMEGNNV